MNNTITYEQMREEYLRRVDNLYMCVRDWIKRFDPEAALSEEGITLTEEPVKPYQAKVLIIERPTYKRIRLTPRGRWIIGANGRVDMKSDLGTEALLYLSEDTPVINIDNLTENGKKLGAAGKPQNPGDIAEGWVFMQNRQIGMLPTLDINLFHRLMEVLGR